MRTNIILADFNYMSIMGGIITKIKIELNIDLSRLKIN